MIWTRPIIELVIVWLVLLAGSLTLISKNITSSFVTLVAVYSRVTLIKGQAQSNGC